MATDLETLRAPGGHRRHGAALALLVAALAGPAAVAQAPAAAGPIDLTAAGAAFALADDIGRRDGGRLWGVPLHGPMLFAHRASRQVVADRPDGAGRLRPAGDLWSGTLEEGAVIANTSVEWGGRRWTMLVWPLPEDPRDRGRLLAHEMFHRVQAETGLPSEDALADHLSARDGRYWLRLEWRALRGALAGDFAARRRAVADALAFRAQRRARFPGAAAAERALELNEGLAEYTGVAAAIPAGETAAWAMGLLERADAASAAADPVRSFAYASGPAYGLLLDAAGASWRPGLDAATDLGDRLAAAYGVDAAAAAAEAPERAAVYDGAALGREEDARAVRRRETQARLRARFVDGPVLRLPAGEEFRYGFDPNAAEVVDGVGTVYLRVRVTDRWGVLATGAEGALLERAGDGWAAAVVPAPADPAARPLAGDGWQLDLAPGWTLAPGPRPGDLRLTPVQ